MSYRDRLASATGDLPLDVASRTRLTTYYSAKGAEGVRVLGVATRDVDPKARYCRDDDP